MSYGECLARISALQRQFGMPMAGVLTTAATSNVSQSLQATNAASLTAAALGTSANPDFAAALQGALSTVAGTTAGATGAATTTAGTSATAPGTTGGAVQADGEDLAAWAKRYTGVPYVAGGRSPSAGWDCAGFTHWVYEQFDIAIPEVSWEQVKQGTGVNGLANAKPGDLLFFHMPGGHDRDPGPMGINHVAMYLGNGRMVEAANPSRGTVVSDVYSGYLKAIRRIAPTGDGVVRTPTDLAQAARIAGAAASANATATTGAASGTTAVTPVSGPASTPQVDSNGALSPRGLVTVLEQAGFSGESLRIAWAVAMRESGGRPAAVGAVNGNGTRDHGLFQLNDIHLGRSIDRSDVYDAAANAAAAFKMSNGGRNWSAWALPNTDGTVTGWAAHLQSSAPSTFAQLQQRYLDWYAKFPGA